MKDILHYLAHLSRAVRSLDDDNGRLDIVAFVDQVQVRIHLMGMVDQPDAIRCKAPVSNGQHSRWNGRLSNTKGGVVWIREWVFSAETVIFTG